MPLRAANYFAFYSLYKILERCDRTVTSIENHCVGDSNSPLPTYPLLSCDRHGEVAQLAEQEAKRTVQIFTRSLMPLTQNWYCTSL